MAGGDSLKSVYLITKPLIKPAQSGFTLIEVMVSLAIVGALLITLLSTLNYHLGVAARHEGLTIASMLAKDKLSQVERNPESVKGDFPEPYIGYSFFSEIRPSMYPGLSELAVTVSNGTDTVTIRELVRYTKK